MRTLLFCSILSFCSIYQAFAQHTIYQQTTQSGNMVKSTQPFLLKKDITFPNHLKSMPLGTFFIPLNKQTEVEDLRLWCGGDFIPVRIGSPEGKVTMFLRGALISTFHGEKGNELSPDYKYYTHAWQDMSSYPQRLLNYRWLVVDKNTTDAEKAGVKVSVDTIAKNDDCQYFTHLQKDEEVYFWLSSCGITNVYFTDEAIFNAVPKAEKPEYAMWDSKNDLTISLSLYPTSVWDDEKRASVNGFWGASLDANRRIIKSRQDITTKSENIYLLREEKTYKKVVMDYEVEVIQCVSDDNTPTKTLYSTNEMLNLHLLVRVKRVAG